ncbi:MAG TPA: YCF48-related protein [Xanthomonadales bacterium]|nr:YCF48-related protein [Xanthomonadales bacterium]
MTRNFITALVLLTATLPALLPGTTAVAQEAELDLEYAEHVPLAAHSLLLDVIRSGNRLIAAGERGHIVFSDDEGKSWQQAEAVPTRATLTKLFALDGRLWAAGHDSVILTSGDQGNTWTRQYFDPERQQPIMDLYFLNASDGIAVGAYGLMLLTADGGQNWEDGAVNDEDDAHLNAIIRLPGGTLLIAGEAGFSYRSRDGGETWESLALPYEGSMFGAVMAGDSCVLFYGLRGHVMRSCDEGDNWEELNSGSEATLLGAAGQDGEVLLAGNSGAILIYNKAGGFSVHEHSSGVDFSAVLALGAGRYLLVGEEGLYLYPDQENAGGKP